MKKNKWSQNLCCAINELLDIVKKKIIWRKLQLLKNALIDSNAGLLVIIQIHNKLDKLGKWENKLWWQMLTNQFSNIFYLL